MIRFGWPTFFHFQYCKSKNPSNFRFGLDGLHYSYMSYFLSCSSQGDFLIWCIIWEKGLSHLLLIKWRRSWKTFAWKWGIYYTIIWEKKLSYFHLMKWRRCIFGGRFDKKILILFLFFFSLKEEEEEEFKTNKSITTYHESLFQANLATYVYLSSD